MSGGLKIARIAGIEIAVHASWLVVFFLVTYSLALSLPRQFPSWSSSIYWLVAAGISLLFFASVLAHELSHALVARRFGLRVTSITLFIFGGAAHLEDEPRRPRDEALIAAAGPASSVLIGLVFLTIDGVFAQPQVQATFGWLGFINVSLGLFNLLPGFPMDGGRILRALLWRVRGDRFAATRNAALVGRAFGYVLVAGGVYLALQRGSLFGGLWIALIGWFITTAAEAASAQMSVERSLRGVTVRDVMEADPPSVGPNESVAELVNERMLRGEHRSFLVRYPDGGLAGIVTLSDVRTAAVGPLGRCTGDRRDDPLRRSRHGGSRAAGRPRDADPPAAGGRSAAGRRGRRTDGGRDAHPPRRAAPHRQPLQARRVGPRPRPVLALEDARSRLLARVRQTDGERVALAEAHNRVRVRLRLPP